MGKIKSILGIVGKVIMGIVLLSTVILNLVMAYIIFAPDSLPKPFHLMYDNNGETAEASDEPAEGSHTEVSESSSDGDEHTLALTPVPLEITPGDGFMVSTGTKVINLADPSGRKYLRVTIVLEFAPDSLEYYALLEEEKILYVNNFTEELNKKMPIINDTLTTILSGKSFEDVYTVEGKDLLRVELMEAINGRIHKNQVIYIYFTEFVIQ